MSRVVNTATGFKYPFVQGSAEERTLYRVMAVDGNTKLYFDCKDEYLAWRQKSMSEARLAEVYTLPGLSADKTTTN